MLHPASADSLAAASDPENCQGGVREFRPSCPALEIPRDPDTTLSADYFAIFARIEAIPLS